MTLESLKSVSLENKSSIRKFFWSRTPRREAIANPGDHDAVISFFFTDSNGQNFGAGMRHALG